MNEPIGVSAKTAVRNRGDKPRRRWLRYSLRTLLVALTIFGIWFGYLADRAYKQRRAIEIVRKYGGFVNYEDESSRIQSRPATPHWLRGVFGEDLFVKVRGVQINFSTIAQTDDNERPLISEEELLLIAEANPRFLELSNVPLTDATMRRLTSYRRLTVLVLRHCGPLTDAGLTNLHNHSQLRHLEIVAGDLRGEGQVQITDDTMREIGQLRRLDRLSIANCEITDKGLAELKNLERLVELEMSNCNVNGSGLMHLAKLPRLKVLHLQRVELNDKGFDALCKLEYLDVLSLQRTNLNAIALDKLKSLSVEVLLLDNNQISAEEAIEFERATGIKVLGVSTGDAAPN